MESQVGASDRYVVLEYLSEGGMGAIYLGKKLGAGGFEKEVVLKQLLPEFTKQAEFIDLFMREARLSATLDHANIVHTIDLVNAGNEHFIVMEYLAGADLRTLIKRARRRRRRFSPAAAIYIAREILSALAYAHAKIAADGEAMGLIHRDVSPSNILISHHGEVKLTDFGIAKAAKHNSVFYKVKGKVGYMSPEQARSEPLDRRADLYSLAVCLYEVLTGERLFVHAGLTTSPDQIYSQPLPLPSRKVTGLPPELDKIMLKALTVDRESRYQTAGEMQEALMRCAHRNGLLMSSSELSAHLKQVCGEFGTWRDHEVRSATPPAGGTEVYDMSRDQGTEQLAVADLDSSAEGDSDAVLSAPAERDASRVVQLGRLQGLELTGMFNLGAIDHVGAKPLIDFADLAPSDPHPEPTVASLADQLDDEAPRGGQPRPPPSPVDLALASTVAAPAPTRGRPRSAPSSAPPLAGPGAAMPVTGPGAAMPVTGPSAPGARFAVPPPPRRRPTWPWAVALLLVGGLCALAIGLSGPNVDPPSDAASPPARSPR